jgi:nucleoside-diphosphate-sugar epimerase
VHLVIGAGSYSGRQAITALKDDVAVRGVEPGDDLAAAMVGVEVVHLAAELHPPGAHLRWDRRPHPLLIEIVRLARAAGVRRLVYCSTAQVYGTGWDVRTKETTPQRPEHAYERLRARDEAWLREQYEPDVVVIRPAQGFGLGEPLTGYVLRQAAAGKLRLPHGGRVSRAFLAGADLGQGFLAAAERGQAGMAYLLGGFEACWRDLVTAAGVALGVPLEVRGGSYNLAYLEACARELFAPVGQECWPTRFVVDALARPQRLEDGWSRRELMWEPAIRSFETGANELVAWFRAETPPAPGPETDPQVAST